MELVHFAFGNRIPRAVLLVDAAVPTSRVREVAAALREKCPALGAVHRGRLVGLPIRCVRPARLRPAAGLPYDPERHEADIPLRVSRATRRGALAAAARKNPDMESSELLVDGDVTVAEAVRAADEVAAARARRQPAARDRPGHAVSFDGSSPCCRSCALLQGRDARPARSRSILRKRSGLSATSSSTPVPRRAQRSREGKGAQQSFTQEHSTSAGRRTAGGSIASSSAAAAPSWL